MTPIYIHALIFQKHVKMCVYIRNIKKPVQLYYNYTLGEYVQQKKVGWEVIFSELGFAGMSGACKPQWEFKGSALEPFFHVFLRLNGASIV